MSNREIPLPDADFADERVPSWTMPEYAKIAQWVEGAQMVWLPLHVSPDGDCIGSTLAFARALRSHGYSCAVVSSDPIPAVYASLFDPADIYIGDKPPGPAATHIACLDISDPMRTGRFYDANKEAFMGQADVKVLNMDHHTTNLRFGDLQLLDTAAPACAEQVAVALNELGWAVDPDIAAHILLGVVTDTLGFRTASTTARTLRVAAHMMDRGASLAKIIDAVFNTHPLSTIFLWAKVLASVAVGAQGRVLYVNVTPQMLKEAGAKEEELEGIASYLSTVRGKVRVAAVLKERFDGTTRASFRSQPGTDVASIARRFGGGGHAQAAGATIPSVGPQAVKQFLDACEDVLNQA
ncbi:MAG: DHHA1 domain-containing protein [Chloroflexota bacterium]|nr:DHHA1 domain-containing protein [Chloroflexota bacterium]